MLNTDIYGMVQQVLATSEAKLAEATGTDGEAPAAEPGEEKSNGASGFEHDPIKVAEACEYLADNIHLVVDTRSTQEKLAEYAALQEAIETKLAAIGDEPQGAHQKEQANSDSVTPMSPPQGGGQPGAGTNQMQSEANMASGSPPEPSGQGQATGEKVNPMTIDPNETAYAGDANNALETNRDDRPGGNEEAIKKVAEYAQARAAKLAELVCKGQVNEKTAAAIIQSDQVELLKFAGGDAPFGGTPKEAGTLPPALQEKAQRVAAAQDPSSPGAEKPGGGDLPDKGEKKGNPSCKTAGIPEPLAQALINKFAEDAINPASISAGTEPELQSASGVPSCCSQGTTAGEGVPGTKGGDQGRDLIQSNVAAINATKGTAKGQRTRAEMGRYLDEPAMAAAHDKTLNQSLDNTSAAGVKIAATSRALLQKWAEADPQNAKVLEEAIAKVKEAMNGMGAGAPPPPAGGGALMGGPGVGSMPMPGGGGEETPVADVQGGGDASVSDAALAAAAAGVSPEDVAQAEEMLAAQMGEGEGTTEAGEEEAAAAAEAPAAEEAQGAVPPEGAPPQAPPPEAPPQGEQAPSA